MRKIILSILGILLIVAAYFAANTIIDSKKRLRPRPAKVIKTVFVDTVKNKTIPIQIAANGNLTAKRRLELYAEVQGIFKGGTHLFKPGQKYQRGQALIELMPQNIMLVYNLPRVIYTTWLLQLCQICDWIIQIFMKNGKGISIPLI